jgi:hypothetical protein
LNRVPGHWAESGHMAQLTTEHDLPRPRPKMARDLPPLWRVTQLAEAQGRWASTVGRGAEARPLAARACSGA